MPHPVAARYHLRRTVLLLSAANLAGITILVASGASGAVRSPAIWEVLLFAAAFAAVGSLRIRLDFSQHRASFTLTEAVLVIGIFHLSPLWLGVAAGAGEGIRYLLNRGPALKAVFNAVSHAATGTVAATVFVACRVGLATATGAWLPALVAVACWGCLNTVSVSTVIAAAEGRRPGRTMSSSLPTAAATTILGTALGLLVQQLWEQGPLYPLLILPIAAGVWLNDRFAAEQRDEHLRIERLYEAAARTADLGGENDVVADIAEEARRLLTGIAAVCFLRDTSGAWEGQVASGGGVQHAQSGDVDELLRHIATRGQSSTIAVVPRCFRSSAPDADMMVAARSPVGSDADLVVAVLRRASAKRRADRGLGDTLAAYVAHGAVTAANARLVSQLQQALEAEMRANQRKDDFVATISHELRTPLTVVLGAVQTLIRLEDRVQPADRDRILHSAEDQGQRLRLLIEDLLMVAAAEHGKLTCDLGPIAAVQLAEDVRCDLPAEIRSLVRIRNTAGDVAARSDRYKVRQIVTNLVGNAAKYAPGSPIEVVLSASTQHLRVSVVDHGPGIPATDRDRVFQRFVQLDQSSTRMAGGTGLGLFICKKLAEQLHATLQLADTPAGGCTFTLGLPVCEPCDAHGDSAALREAKPGTPALHRRPRGPFAAEKTAA